MCRPRHGHSTVNSPHSFRGRILAPALYVALSMDLFLGPQQVSTYFSLRSLMSRSLLLHILILGERGVVPPIAWTFYRYLTSFLSYRRILAPGLSFAIDGSIPWSAVRKYLLLPSLVGVSLSSSS